MTYHVFHPQRPAPGAMVVRLYPTGGRVRGFVRRLGSGGDDDSIFPGEEMEPDAAFELARSRNEGDTPILVEMLPGAHWDPAWGKLDP